VGWLDAPHNDTTATQPNVKVDTALFAQVVAVVSHHMQEMSLRLDMTKFETVVAIVYEEALQTREINEASVQKYLKLAR
jgi:hypothetical protein